MLCSFIFVNLSLTVVEVLVYLVSACVVEVSSCAPAVARIYLFTASKPL